MTQTDSLYRLTKNDANKGATVLKNAFIDYPAFKYLFPETNERKKKLIHVMSFLLKCGLLRGEVLAPSKNMEAVAIWYKSANLNFGFTSLLKAGLISTACNLNMKSFIRFKKLGEAKRINKNILPEKEYYFLDMIGTDPAFKKKGYAKLLIDAILEKIDRERMSCILETSNIKNIDYYSKYGFILFNKYTYDGLESYYLIRE